MKHLLCLAAFLYVLPLEAAITFVDSDAQGPAGSAMTIACNAINVPSGSLIVVAVRWFNTANSVSTVADTASNTFAERIAKFSEGSVNMQVFDVQNATGNATDVITVTFDASTNVREIGCVSYSGVAASSAPDQTCTGKNSSGTTVSCSAGITTTQADEVLIEFSEHNTGTDRTATWDSGFTERELVPQGGGAAFGFADRIVSSTQSFTPSVTWSADDGSVNMIAVVTYKAAAAATGPVNPFLIFGD